MLRFVDSRLANAPMPICSNRQGTTIVVPLADNNEATNLGESSLTEASNDGANFKVSDLRAGFARWLYPQDMEHFAHREELARLVA
jgi:hypothetical protein